MLTYVNTNNIEEIGNDIISLASEYNMQVNKLFKRLAEVPSVTKEWVGQEANKYFQVVALEKKDFIDFGNSLHAYGKKVLTDVATLDNTIKKNTEIENKKDLIWRN